MKDDLNKAERRWARRRLFAPKPRRHWVWWLLLVLALPCVLLYLLTDPHIAEVLDLPRF